MSAPTRDDLDSVLIGKDATRVDLVSRLPTVSSVHARITRADDGWTIEDLGSTNGTYVDGARLEPHVARPLAFGAWITLGKRNGFTFGPSHVLKVTDPGAFAAPAPLDLDTPSSPPAAGTVVDGSLSAERGAAAARVERSGRNTVAVAALTLPPLRSGADPVDADEFAAVEDTSVSRAPRVEDVGAEAVVDTDPIPPGAATLTIGYDTSNDVVVPNAVVSGRHARIGFDGRRFVLEDQGSTNGTWYGGQRIQRVEIRVGEAFAVGGVRLAFDADLERRLQERDVGPRGPASSNALPTGRRVTVGRAPGSDLVIDAPMVSTHHLVLEVIDGGYVVTDLDSTNGTFLNRRENRISAPVTVDDADVLYLGSYRLPVARVAALVGADASSSSTIALPARRAVIVGRDPAADVTIDQPQVSRRHAEVVQLDDGAFEIRDLGSSNGVYVNGQRIHTRTRVAADDRVSIGGVDLRLDAERGVVHRAYSGDIMLQAQRVSVDVPDNARRGATKRILSDVSFTAYPSEFVGLMGPSGAGKTTLMMALNGYTPPVTGQSLINGVDLYANYNAFRGNIGYVPQDDIVFPQLTVHESLWYTARLRLPPDTTGDEIEARIERILEVLEIQGTRDVRIGDAVKKGISGGQRKRVNLAQELITEPSLLFLDEPTSGLASEDTINVMRLLRGLADEGRTILLTIHQPSLEAYRLMDNVIYLFNGHLVYYGPTWPDSIDFFHPDAADADRTALRADPGNALKPLAQDQRAVYERPRDEQPAALDEAIRDRKQKYVDSPQYRQFVYDRVGRQAAQDVHIDGGRKQKTDRKGLLRQWWILTQRAALIKWKDRLNTFILMVQAPVIACVLAAVFAVDAETTAWVDELVRGPAALFLLVASSVWFGASNSAREIVTEQAIYRRERMVNLAIPSYVSSKFAVLGVVSALQCLIMLCIVWWPLSLEGSFGLHYVILLMTSLVGLGMGLTLSALVRSAEAAVALVPLLLIPQIILGGVIMPVHEMNTPMRLLSNLMAARWGYEAALHVEYGDDDLTKIRDRCEIPDCVWAIGPTGFTFYAGDPDTARAGEQTGGVDALGDLPPSPSAVVEAPLCEAFCASLRFGDEITPLDRSFGADPADPVREAARVKIVEENDEPDAWTAPTPHARTSLARALGVLGGALAFLGALVMSLLRYRDVEVG